MFLVFYGDCFQGSYGTTLCVSMYISLTLSVSVALPSVLSLLGQVYLQENKKKGESRG